MNHALLAVLLVVGAYYGGRIEQYFRDEKRGIGRKGWRRD